MSPQLAAVLEELRDARERLHRLRERVPPERWTPRIDPDRWSVAECVEHLNLTSRAYLPVIRGALEEGRRLGGGAPGRYRRDPVGWLLWRTMGPPVRLRMKTPAAFVPVPTESAEELVAEFDRLQAELIELTGAADGLPLRRLRVTSPFDARASYNLFSALSILPRHQHRHLWQAERLVADGR
jgi:DinB superfamily